jgi:TRAP-type C4-dicarboxylate transport system permease small subunit
MAATEVEVGGPRAHVGGRALLHRLEEGVLVMLVGALLVLAFSQILLRNFLGITWLWGDPLVRHLVLWASFLGALIATREDRHIRIDAVLRLLPPRPRLVATALGDAVAAAICLILAPLAARFVIDEHDYGGDAFLGLPRWTLQLVFPFVFAGMGLRFAGRAVTAVHRALSTRGAG